MVEIKVLGIIKLLDRDEKKDLCYNVRYTNFTPTKSQGTVSFPYRVTVCRHPSNAISLTIKYNRRISSFKAKHYRYRRNLLGNILSADDNIVTLLQSNF